MDAADLAQMFSDDEERQILADRLKPKGLSAVFCSDCAGAIPQKRRELVPGVQTCISCQKNREMGRYD